MIINLIDRMRLLFVGEKKPFLQLKEILGFYPHNIKLYQLALMHKSVAYYERERLREEAKQAKQEEDRQNKTGKNSSKAGKDSADKGFKNSESSKKGGKGKDSTKKGDKNYTSGKRDFSRTLVMNNERLEFLGDAVLGAIVADILYKHYGNKQEGFLTSLRSKIVCRNSLNKLAVNLGLDKLILYTGAATTAHNSYMNGNAFEAFFGAIYLDRGYKYCYRFLEDVVFKKHINIEAVAKQERNFKSALIEWCQKYKFNFEFVQKEYREKENHSTPVFKCSVLIEGIPCGTGEGYSKKESDQKAAQQALQKVKRDKALQEGIKIARDRHSSSAKDSEKCE